MAIRFNCKCGKILRVDDNLQGKKVKCPNCAAIQVAKSSSETATSPRPHAAPGTRQGASPAPPKRGQREGNESRIKPANKANRNLLLLLAGGGGAVVVLGIVTLAAWYFFLRSNTKTAAVPTPSNKTDSGEGEQANKKEDGKEAPKGEPVAIKLFVPHKVGDRREVKMVASRKMEMVIPKDAKMSADLKAMMAGQGLHERTILQGIVTTLEVDDTGEETKVNIVLKQIKHEQVDSKRQPDFGSNMPKEAVVLGTRTGSKWLFSNPEGGPSPLPFLGKDLNDFCSGRYLQGAESDLDNTFGTPAKQPVGGTWSLNKDRIAKTFSEDMGGGPDKQKARATIKSGSGKLLKVISEAGGPYLDVELKIEGLVDQGEGISATLQAAINVRLPRDGSRGPVKRVTTGQIEVDVPLPVGEGAKVLVKATNSETVTLDITYLGKPAEK